MNGITTPPGGDEEAAATVRAQQASALGLGIALALVLLELALRVAPQAISPKMLVLFEPGLRASIASGTYPLQNEFRSIERDDGGPPLFVELPRTRIVSVDEPQDHATRFTDEAGFCNPPGRYEGHDRIDVIAIGDSFTWCHALVPEKAWPALLGERDGVSTFSLGLGGNGPYEYLQLLESFGLAKHPRVVVMNVYGGNDLRDAQRYMDYHEAVEQGRQPPSDGPQPIAPELLASSVGRHSYALNLLLAAASQLAAGAATGWERTGIDFHYRIDVEGGDLAFNVENRDRDEVVMARRLVAGTTSPQVWEAALRRFASMARDHGFSAVVTYTPSAHVTYAGHVRFSDPSIEPLLTRLDEEQRDFLASRAPALGILFDDLTPELRAAASDRGAGSLLYDPVHMHLSARGNVVLADAVGSFLRERGLVGSAAVVANAQP
ncbi:MAG TPA: hypothetical protein VGK20_18905 [Candidatus Binatia bacterium]|jgi:hypothetical protein